MSSLPSVRDLLTTKALLRIGALGAAAVAALAALRIGEWTTADQILVFVVVPGAIAAGLLALSWAPLETRRNAMLLLLSIGLAVFAAEVTLQYWGQSPQRLSNAGGPVWAPGSRTELIRSLRAAGERVYPIIPGQMLTPLRLGPDSLQPLSPAVSDARAVLCDELGVPVLYDGTGYGFNNPPGVWASDSVPLAIIGDSYTQGVCVEPGLNFPDAMRRRWPGLVNVGVSGSGPLSQLGLLKEYVAPLRPRTVLWVYYEGNDLIDLSLEEGDEVLPRYLDAGFTQDLMARQPELDRLIAAHLDSLMASAGDAGVGVWSPPVQPSFLGILRTSLRMSALRDMLGVGSLVPRKGSSLRSLPAVLAEAKRTVESWDGRLVVAYLPAYRRFHAWIGEAHHGHAEFLAVADSLGLQAVDLVAAFEETGDPKSLWAHPQGHLSPEGYAFVADVLVGRLDEGAPPRP